MSEWSKNSFFLKFFKFFKIFKFLFEKRPQGDLGNVNGNKVMKYELIWSVLRGVTHDHLWVRAHCVPRVV